MDTTSLSDLGGGTISFIVFTFFTLLTSVPSSFFVVYFTAVGLIMGLRVLVIEEKEVIDRKMT
jgi:hypothetical protein